MCDSFSVRAIGRGWLMSFLMIEAYKEINKKKKNTKNTNYFNCILNIFDIIE